MVWLAALGGGAFVLACLVLGARLLWLARRTRDLPALTLGLGLFLMGGLSYPLTVCARVVPGLGDGQRVAVALLSQVLMVVGVASVCWFNWRVFRPTSRFGAVAMMAVVGAFLGLGIHQWIDPGFLAYAARNEGIYRWSVPVTGIAMYWATFESWRYHALLVRRRTLGLADPVVLDRVRLWGITTAAASVINVFNGACQVAGIDPATSPVSAFVTGVLGLAAAGGLWLAFFPPRAYLRRVAARAA